jgi:hypothetical protein
MTLTAPKRFAVDRKAERVVVWSPPRVTILGVVYSLELVSLEDTTWNPQSEFSMAQPWSQAKLLHEICQVASKRLYCPRNRVNSTPGEFDQQLTRYVNGASPQSIIFAQSTSTFSPGVGQSLRYIKA